jgi:hypothetical protein
MTLPTPWLRRVYLLIDRRTSVHRSMRADLAVLGAANGPAICFVRSSSATTRSTTAAMILTLGVHSNATESVKGDRAQPAKGNPGGHRGQVSDQHLKPDFYQVSAHGPGYLMSVRASRRSGGSGSLAVRVCWPARIWMVR